MSTKQNDSPNAPRSDKQRALVRQLKHGGEEAGRVLRDLLRNPHDATTELRLAIRRHPVTALAALRRPSEELGLTERGAADALDEVIAEVDTPERPRHETQRMLRQGLSRERLRELLLARGDLGSIAALIADARTVIEVMLTDAGDESAADRFFTIRSWAVKLHEREDWERLLGRSIPELDGRTLMDIILACLYHEVKRTADDEDADEEDEHSVGGVTIEPDEYESVGIDAETGRARIRAMLRDNEMPEFSEAEIMRARVRITERRQRRERAAQTRELLAATDAAKKQVDIE